MEESLMHRRWPLLFLCTLFLVACGGTAEAGTRATPTSAGSMPTVSVPPTASAAPTASDHSTIPTATPTPLLATAFPTFAAGQSSVYVVDYYRTIRVVDPQAAMVVGELPVGPGALPVFSPDGSRLYVTYQGQRGDSGARLAIFDVATGRHIAGASGLELMAYKIWGPPIIAPSRDGRTVYLHGRRITSQPEEAGRDTCWIYTFDVITNRLSPETIPLPTCRIAPLILAADGRTLYSGPWLIDLTTHPATVRENVDFANAAITQSADGRWLYALDQSGTITVWDTNARRAVRKFPDAVPGYGSFIYLNDQGLSLTRDGTRLFIATDDGDASQQDFKGVIVMDSATGQRIASVHMDHPFRSLTISADGATLYIVGRNILEIQDAATGMRHAKVSGVGESAGPVLAPPPP